MGLTLAKLSLIILDGVTATTTQINYLAAATGTTGTNTTNVVYSTTPTFTTSIVLTGADADPGAAGGTIVYDNAITDILDGGALRWNDTGAAGALGVRLLVDLDTDPSDDGFVCCLRCHIG